MNSFLETIKKFGYISESVEIDILKNINTENKKKAKSTKDEHRF
jgi:hypothetical protein